MSITRTRHARPMVEAVEPRRHLSVTGLTATHFDHESLSGESVTTAVPRATFDHGSGSPVERFGNDGFSTRMTGRLRAPSSESYRFYVMTDGRVRVWIRGELVVDSWNRTGLREARGNLRFVAGKRYEVTIEYAHGTGESEMAFRWQSDTRRKGSVAGKWFTPRADELSNQIDSTLAFASDQIGRTLAQVPTPANGYPMRVRSNGLWELAPGSDWTSGYFAGVMWEMDRARPGRGWDTLATPFSLPLAGESAQSGDHFSRIWTTFKPLYDKTGSRHYRDVLLRAADAKLNQFSTKIKAFETPNLPSNSGDPSANFAILVDQSMDMELLAWAGFETQRPIYRERAIAHLHTAIKYLQRPDGSVYQRAFFNRDTGQFIAGENYQGYDNESTWSRGLAWAIHAWAEVAERTGIGNFAYAAQRAADYWIANVPADYVPYWDFDAPSILTDPANTPRDTSAAAIAVSGMLRLADIFDDARYKTFAEATLRSLLSGTYLTRGSSTTNEIASRGILDHGSQLVPKNRGVNTALIFGDYHLIQAMNDYRLGV